jgi:transcriptional regulator with XRE-family HTH domain
MYLPSMTYAPPWGLKLVRRVRRLRREELAAATGLPAELIADYESERQPLPTETLVHVFTALRLTEEERTALGHSMPHFDLRLWRGGPMDLPRPSRAVIERASREVGRRAQGFAEWRMLKGGTAEEIQEDIEREQVRCLEVGHILFLVYMMILQASLREKARHPSPSDRQKGEKEWRRLGPTDLKRVRLIAEASTELASWALCERMGLASVDLAGTAPEKSRELAEITLLLVKKTHAGPAMRRRLRGFAAACLGTARLALGDRAGAEEALQEARRLWEAGTAEDTKILSGAPLRTLETALAAAKPRRRTRRGP